MAKGVPFNPGNIKTGTLGLPPGVSNLTFAPSAQILPSMHIGPRTYNDAGFVAHPLSYTGQPGPVRGDKTPPAGALTTAPGGIDFAIAHPFTIGGREPG